jgi:hypothetical protein
MSHTIRERPHRKAKKSFTLSPESVEFLETLCKKRHALSVSAVLEELLQTSRREQARTALGRSVADYYSSLSSEESEEHARWGDFALREFPNEEA